MAENNTRGIQTDQNQPVGLGDFYICIFHMHRDFLPRQCGSLRIREETPSLNQSK